MSGLGLNFWLARVLIHTIFGLPLVSRSGAAKLGGAVPIQRLLAELAVFFPVTSRARPADDIDIDPLEGRAQLRPIELAVVVDPAFDVLIVLFGQILQGLVTVMVKRPTPDGPANGR